MPFGVGFRSLRPCRVSLLPLRSQPVCRARVLCRCFIPISFLIFTPPIAVLRLAFVVVISNPLHILHVASVRRVCMCITPTHSHLTLSCFLRENSLATLVSRALSSLSCIAAGECILQRSANSFSLAIPAPLHCSIAVVSPNGAALHAICILDVTYSSLCCVCCGYVLAPCFAPFRYQRSYAFV